jgi:hypothetical protein
MEDTERFRLLGKYRTPTFRMEISHGLDMLALERSGIISRDFVVYWKLSSLYQQALTRLLNKNRSK